MQENDVSEGSINAEVLSVSVYQKYISASCELCKSPQQKVFY